MSKGAPISRKTKEEILKMIYCIEDHSSEYGRTGDFSELFKVVEYRNKIKELLNTVIITRRPGCRKGTTIIEF